MKRNKNERGQSLVELGISIVVLMWLLAGAVEFGIAFFQYIQIRDAAQEGALYGSLNPTDTANIEKRVWGAAKSADHRPYQQYQVLILPTHLVHRVWEMELQ